MAKIQQAPKTGLYPVPMVMVSCVDSNGKPNIITIAWAGVVNSTPPMLSVALRHSRYSYGLIKQTGDFVINIPKEDQAWAADFCGQVSGRDVDKFKEAHLTPIKASLVKSPLIQECPVNLECVVKQRMDLGSHELFWGEVVATHIDEEYCDERGHWDIARLRPLAYCGGDYWSLGKLVGKHGFSRKGQT
ncbi:MAG: flavin reductase family protein [Chloroflexi bacterium]|nr:flavin reductase family protein [Chloroflexota bacterium]